jgi:hypothetical protein
MDTPTDWPILQSFFTLSQKLALFEARKLPGFLFPIRKSSLRNKQIAFAAVVVAELLGIAYLFSRAGEIE